MRRFILPAALLLSIATARAADTQPASPPASPPSNFSLTVHVQSQISDGGHLPVAGATITRIGTAGDDTPLAVTAPNGAARITLPAAAAAKNFALLASRDGYVPAYKSWSRKTPADLPPTDLTFALEPAATLGGKVVDTDGQPFKNAAVIINASKKYPAALDQNGYAHIHATTNAAGNFTSHELPETFDYASVGFYSLDALSSSFYELTEMHSLDEIRHWAAALRLQRGSPVTISLEGPNHLPLKNAFLDIGMDWDVSNRIPPLPFPDSGKITLGLLPTVSLLATARAPGFAPQQLTLHADEPAPPALTLHPATPLALTIVDKDNHPIPTARAIIRHWGKISLDQDLHATDGHATWPDAPDPGQPILAQILAPGFVTRSDVPLGQDNTITLVKRPTITGTVTDAATHQPLTTFHVEQGIVWKEGTDPVWQPSDSFDSTATRTSPGHFEIKPGSAYAGIALRVTATDHLPADIKPFKIDGTDHDFTFDLQPGKGLSGKLVDADGKPLPKMNVYRITSLPDLENNRLRDFDVGYLPHTTSADDGSFAFPPQAEPYALLVLNDTGIATASRKSIKPGEPLTLTLVRFGTLEGEVRFSTKPAPEGTLVTLRDPEPDAPPDEILLSSLHHLSTRTDKTGHFTLTRIPPGEHTLVRIIPGPKEQPLSGDRTRFRIVPGQTSHALIGGEGRPVTGKVDLAPLKGRPFAVVASVYARLNLPDLEKLPPDDVQKQGPDAVRLWIFAYMQSPEGKRRQETIDSAKTVPCQVAPDGTFRLENVTPGEYTLAINLYPPVNPNSPDRFSIQAHNSELTLPDSPTTDTPFDTGTLPLAPFNR